MDAIGANGEAIMIGFAVILLRGNEIDLKGGFRLFAGGIEQEGRRGEEAELAAAFVFGVVAAKGKGIYYVCGHVMERFQHIGLAAGVGSVDGGEGQDLLLSDGDDVGGVLGDIGCGEVQRRVIPEGQVVLKIKLQKHVHSPLICCF